MVIHCHCTANTNKVADIHIYSRYYCYKTYCYEQSGVCITIVYETGLSTLQKSPNSY